MWVATRLFTTTQWASQGEFNYDGGMAKVGTTTDDTQGTNDLRLSCNMTGGSSCGPWFQSSRPAAQSLDNAASTT